MRSPRFLSASRHCVPDRADDVPASVHRRSRARHLVLHGDQSARDIALERDADRFAAEFLTPNAVMANVLPRRLISALGRLATNGSLGQVLVYRSHSDLLSDATARRLHSNRAAHQEGELVNRPVISSRRKLPKCFDGPSNSLSLKDCQSRHWHETFAGSRPRCASFWVRSTIDPP